MGFRLGVDLGGTKTEVAVLDEAGEIVWRRRAGTPAGYGEIVGGIVALVRGAASALGGTMTVGVGIPGVISRRRG